MRAPPAAPTRRSPLKDALFAPLALLAVVMAIVIWQQRAELRRLAAEAPPPAARAEISVRPARARSVLVLPPASPAEVPLRDDADFLAAAEAARPARTRPADTSALARLLANPEFFQALGLQRQATLDTRFAALFRQLALDDAGLTAFKRLLAEKDSVALDVVAVSEMQAEGPLPPAQLGASIAAARTQVEAAIRAALGEERYAVYREYERTLPQRALVAQLEQRLSYSPAPLAPAQTESLVRVLVAHAPPALAEGGTRPTPMVVEADAAAAPLVQSETAPARVSEAAVVESQAVLAPRQVAALREIQLEQQASQRALELLRDSLPQGERRASLSLRMFLQ